MTSRRRFLASAAALWAAGRGPAWAATAAADPARIALVVGNDAYRASPLANAGNDARAMAALLAEARFRVEARTDLPGEALRRAAGEFAAAAARPEVKLALFYYAGHGVQVDWRNYLLPVDADVANASELKTQCFDLNGMLAELARARDKTFVLVLDACRDNPFGAGWRPEHKGLSQFDAPVGSLIAFSTAPGSVAADGTGRHGLYTENLVRELAVRGARIEDALKRVRLSVRLASNGAQIPWESTSLETDVLLFPEGPAKADEEEEERRVRAEAQSWERLRDSRRVEDWAAFLREYPGGRYSEVAQARLDALLAEREAPAKGKGKGPGARRLVIDASHPVPDFLRRAGDNPFSAGTFPLGRHFAVGDEAVFEEVDPASGRRKRLHTLRVTKVDAAANRVEVNGGAIVHDLLGNPVKRGERTFDHPVQVHPAELQVGKRWVARYVASKDGREAEFDMHFRVVRRERVNVPAGEFDAFRIEGRGTGTRLARHPGRNPAAPGPVTESTTWVVPGLNFPVQVDQSTRAPRIGEKRELTRLVSLRQGG